MEPPKDAPKLMAALLIFAELGGCQAREIKDDPAIDPIREYEKCTEPSVCRA